MVCFWSDQGLAQGHASSKGQKQAYSPGLPTHGLLSQRVFLMQTQQDAVKQLGVGWDRGWVNEHSLSSQSFSPWTRSPDVPIPGRMWQSLASPWPLPSELQDPALPPCGLSCSRSSSFTPASAEETATSMSTWPCWRQSLHSAFTRVWQQTETEQTLSFLPPGCLSLWRSCSLEPKETLAGSWRRPWVTPSMVRGWSLSCSHSYSHSLSPLLSHSGPLGRWGAPSYQEWAPRERWPRGRNVAESI